MSAEASRKTARTRDDCSRNQRGWINRPSRIDCVEEAKGWEDPSYLPHCSTGQDGEIFATARTDWNIYNLFAVPWCGQETVRLREKHDEVDCTLTAPAFPRTNPPYSSLSVNMTKESNQRATRELHPRNNSSIQFSVTSWPANRLTRNNSPRCCSPTVVLPSIESLPVTALVTA